MPYIIVQMSRLPWTVPVGCEVAKSHGIRAGATGNLQLAKALESEPCCHSGRDWIAINDAAVAAVSAVGGTSAVPILNYLEEHVKGETTLRLAPIIHQFV